MPDLLTVALGIALGFMLGAIFGTRRAVRLMLSTRRLRGAHARLSRFMPDAAPTRTASDILAGRVRLQFGGVVYDLPVLPRAASRKWLEELDGSFAALALALEEAGDDAPQLLALLSTQTDRMYDALLAYDTSNVLPSRDELDEIATDAEVLHAVLEVWRAANPLAAIVAEQSPPTNGTSPAQPTSPPTPTAGDPTTSSGSPTSRSSSTSTPPRSEPKPPPPSASKSRSKPSASATSSPATGRHTTAGTTALASPAPRGRV